MDLFAINWPCLSYHGRNDALVRLNRLNGLVACFFATSVSRGADFLVRGFERLRSFAQSASNEMLPQFSPDGHYIAYASDESGRYEVYIQLFPSSGRKWQVSAFGARVAVQSHWFSVGSNVSWAEAGVGAVATQSFIDPFYGKLGLDLMRAGKSTPESLKGLVAADGREVRQVAMISAFFPGGPKTS